MSQQSQLLTRIDSPREPKERTDPGFFRRHPVITVFGLILTAVVGRVSIAAGLNKLANLEERHRP